MRPWIVLVASVACAGPSADDRTGAPRTALSTATFARYDAGAVPGGPGQGRRYALGRPPADSLLVELDDDVGRDGAELPAGRGSVAEGAALYARLCASCHGAEGEGVAPHPVLVGRDSLSAAFAFGRDPKVVKSVGNYWPHATTIFDYVRRAMPLNAPGSLTDAEVYALTAWLLAANGILPGDAVLDADALRRVRMPARDRFVDDDRVGGPGVR